MHVQYILRTDRLVYAKKIHMYDVSFLAQSFAPLSVRKPLANNRFPHTISINIL